MWDGPLEKIDEFRHKIPKTYKPEMRVDGIIYASDKMIEQIRADNAPEQVANVATLPGIVKHSLAMPDIHWGYGFCIGGVAAFDVENEGIISPGGVGYDINCGVRLLRTNFVFDDIKNRIEGLIQLLFARVPAGLGKGGKLKYEENEMRRILAEGVKYLYKKGLATERDLECCEANGVLPDANPDDVSERAYQRGKNQCGTLGSGNHFLEIQQVTEIYESQTAESFGLKENQIVVMIHSGSRGLGYQICDDAIKLLRNVPDKLGIKLPDRQLVCAPINSKEGQKYLSTMRCAANFAWANRQLITYLVRQVFCDFFDMPIDKIGLELIYDVAHNIAKIERHKVNDKEKILCVHRKGATRAFPAGHSELPSCYRSVGQPVIIPGDMGRASFVLAGVNKAMKETFGSVCHGAGRMLSRKAALKTASGNEIKRKLAQQGIIVLSGDSKGLAEEQPAAYKDVSLVVDVVTGAGLAKKVAKTKPLAVIKG